MRLHDQHRLRREVDQRQVTHAYSLFFRKARLFLTARRSSISPPKGETARAPGSLPRQRRGHHPSSAAHRPSADARAARSTSAQGDRPGRRQASGCVNVRTGDENVSGARNFTGRGVKRRGCGSYVGGVYTRRDPCWPGRRKTSRGRLAARDIDIPRRQNLEAGMVPNNSGLECPEGTTRLGRRCSTRTTLERTFEATGAGELHPAIGFVSTKPPPVRARRWSSGPRRPHKTAGGDGRRSLDTDGYETIASGRSSSDVPGQSIRRQVQVGRRLYERLDNPFRFRGDHAPPRRGYRSTV